MAPQKEVAVHEGERIDGGDCNEAHNQHCARQRRRFC